MDVQALLVFVGGFALCAVVGYLVTFLGAKEQTYEEALKAQKERNKESKKPGKVKNADINKKKKWKKSVKGDGGSSGKNDPDAEEEVVLVESVKEEVVEQPPTPVELTPEPSPLPTPEPKKKSKKKKIQIEDVEKVEEPAVEEVVVVDEVEVEEAPAEEEEVEQVAVEEAAVAEVAAPATLAPEPAPKATPTKTKAKKQKQELQPTYTAAPPAGVSTPRDLLTAIKKTCFNDEEAQSMINMLLTKQTGQLNTSEEWIEPGKPSESKQLKQELAEANKSLEEERNNKIYFERQLTTLRKDLNEKLAGVKKAANAEHQRILQEQHNQHSHQLAQANARLAEMHNNEMGMRGRMEEINLEKLHTVSQYQAQVDTLSHQLQMAQNVPTPTFNDPSLLSELEQLRALRDRYEGQLNEFLLENKSLKEKLSGLQGAREEVSRVTSTSSALASQLASVQAEASALGLSKAGLEVELARVQGQLGEARAGQDQAASGQATAASAQQSELAGVRARLAAKEAETVKLAEENERLAEQLASSVERPAADGEESAGLGSNGHREVEEPGKVLASELGEWRDKFERLHMDHEKMLAKQKVVQCELEAQLTGYRTDLETANCKKNELTTHLATAPSALLTRLFPSLAPCTEEQALQHLASLSSPKGEEVERLGDQVEVERLGEQVEHYKTVLAQTESMLTSLQRTVEGEEEGWRLKLEVAARELAESRAAAASLATKASALEREVAEAGDQREMQGQLAALQAQLASQQEERKQLEAKNTELSAKVEEMATGNTSLQAALALAQEAVEKEQGGLKALQEQLLAGKDVIHGNGTGPSEEV